MAQVRTVTITAARKVSENYNTRDYGVTVTLEVGEEESPGALIKEWGTKLRAHVDAAVGDATSPASFAREKRQEIIRSTDDGPWDAY